MTGETDTQLGGGYTYQWESAILLALNYFFEPVPYEATLYDLVTRFLGQVAEIKLEEGERGAGTGGAESELEGEDRAQHVELEDINLINGPKRVLIQVKTKQAEGERWTPSDPLLLKALYRFYDNHLSGECGARTRYVFLTNGSFNPDLVEIKAAIARGAVDRCPEADTLRDHLDRYARGKGKPPVDLGRFREMIARTALVKYLDLDAVTPNVQAKLQGYGRSDWRQAYAVLFAHFAKQSTRRGGGAVTRDSILEVLGPRPGTLRDQEIAYLDRLLDEYRLWREHYTPLAGVAEVRAAGGGGLEADRLMPLFPPEFVRLGGPEPGGEVRRERVSDLREAIDQHRRIILLGDPGSGKTTTLKLLVHECAQRAVQDPKAPLPVLVSLGAYTDDRPLEAHVADQLGALGQYAYAHGASERLCILLDGLNEMPRSGYAARVGRIQSALTHYSASQLVVTCRALDYDVELAGVQRVEISPLDPTRVRALLHSYLGEERGEYLFWELCGGDEARALWQTWQDAGGAWEQFWTPGEMPKDVYAKTTGAQDRLWERLTRMPPDLLTLAGNPYMLAMLVRVYQRRRVLPQNRGRLFEDFVGTLLDREEGRAEGNWIAAETQKTGLAALAYAMQREGGRGTSVKREWALAQLCEAAPGCDPERLLYLASSATLLDTDGATVRFYHQLLQEYFAAREVEERAAGEAPPSAYWPSGEWWEPSGWEETFILAAGISRDPAALLERLARAHPVLAGRCVLESGVEAAPEARERIVQRLVGVLADASLPASARVQAGDDLARLGDPRPGVGLRRDSVPDIAWCEAPAGPFTMGSGDVDEMAYTREKPQHDADLPAFRIAKYPVTVAQYDAFVRDGGYSDTWRACWTEAGWAWKGDRTAPDRYGGPFDLPNHPVVMVSWYEAIAFCRWLTVRLRDAGELAADEVVTLPREAQWEKAARGTDGRIYPWGDAFDAGKANTAETGIGSTSAVGCFPAGVSPCGSLDMAGNVWEWCRTAWQGSYEAYVDDSVSVGDLAGDAPRVLRGGAFYLDRDSARCTCRSGFGPDFRLWYVGFRVVVSLIS
ncbi:MAG: SUMF1/EgtB/PvdO family nonheme iron enzyme [Anaerolineae bacterium]|nr:SUMF1/EgtB/PvdO family nonheme iron enzyme [Anaerolineae bacterium]